MRGFISELSLIHYSIILSLCQYHIFDYYSFVYILKIKKWSPPTSFSFFKIVLTIQGLGLIFYVIMKDKKKKQNWEQQLHRMSSSFLIIYTPKEFFNNMCLLDKNVISDILNMDILI